MSTMLVSGAATTPRLTAAMQRVAALRAAFWLRIRRTLAPAVSFLKAVGAKVLGLVPSPVLGLAASVPFVTRWGFDQGVRFVSWVGRGAGWAVRRGARLVHDAINVVGHGLANFVAVFSPNAGNAVSRGVVRFSDQRELVAGWLRQHAEGAIDRIKVAMGHPFTRATVGATAAVVAGTIAVNVLAPATFASLLASLPVTTAGALASVSMGGLGALNPIGAVFLLSTLGVLVARMLRRPTPVAEAGRPADVGSEIDNIQAGLDAGTLTDEQARVLANQALTGATQAGTGRPKDKGAPKRHGGK